MIIKFLKAGEGDAILIHHNKKNILIDGGNEPLFLLNELDLIYQKGEKIDLLVITHHDDDHIRGVLTILQQIEQSVFGENKDFVSEVYFNSPRLVLKKAIPKNAQLLSYEQAYDVEKILPKIKTNWESIITNRSPSIEFDKMTLSFLSPLECDLDEYSKDPKVHLTCQTKGDWDSSLYQLDKYIDDRSQDKSISNKSSIVILLEFEGKKILLTGDATPDRLAEILNDLFVKNGNTPIQFDYIKLPHHGSYRNLNKEILSKIHCSNFVITTNGKNSYLPDKRAILKVIKYISKNNEDKVNFIFNYSEVIGLLGISSAEKTKYKISLTPNNEINGYVIR